MWLILPSWLLVQCLLTTAAIIDFPSKEIFFQDDPPVQPLKSIDTNPIELQNLNTSNTSNDTQDKSFAINNVPIFNDEEAVIPKAERKPLFIVFQKLSKIGLNDDQNFPRVKKNNDDVQVIDNHFKNNNIFNNVNKFDSNEKFDDYDDYKYDQDKKPVVVNDDQNFPRVKKNNDDVQVIDNHFKNNNIFNNVNKFDSNEKFGDYDDDFDDYKYDQDKKPVVVNDDYREIEDFDKDSYVSLLKERDLLKKLNVLEKYRFLLFGSKRKNERRIYDRISGLRLAEMKAYILDFMNKKTEDRVKNIFSENIMSTDDFYAEVNYLLKMVKLIDKIRTVEEDDGKISEEIADEDYEKKKIDEVMKGNNNNKDIESKHSGSNKLPCLMVKENQLLKTSRDTKIVQNNNSPCILVEISRVYHIMSKPKTVNGNKPCVFVLPKGIPDRNDLQFQSDNSKEKITFVVQNIAAKDAVMEQPKDVQFQPIPDGGNGDLVDNKIPDDNQNFRQIKLDQWPVDAPNKTDDVKIDPVAESNDYHPGYFIKQATPPNWEMKIWALYKHYKIFGIQTSSQYRQPWHFYTHYPLRKRGMSVLTRLFSGLVNRKNGYKSMRKFIPPEQAMYFFKESNMFSAETRTRPIGTPFRWG